MKKDRVIYDVLYGFIRITEWEEKIINSPFYQRLRWIKQLGFSNYIFPGAEHNRFAHAIGVMQSMDHMIRALGLQVSDDELFDPKAQSKEAMFHKSLRIGALLHDVGTFPFSHAIEYAYIRHGNDDRAERKITKKLPNNHEHLGSFIIKNTNYEGGLTKILTDYGFDIQKISDIIKGDSPNFIANQLMHSDLDADRMDYLLRDAHYTGLQYGKFDRDYILANLTHFSMGDSETGFGVRENAMNAVEDFLISRFNWYSQIIKNPASAKFDILSTFVTKALLEKNLIYQFHDLLSMIENRDERFFWFNDIYFMNRCQEIREKSLVRDHKVQEWMEMLLYRIPPKTIRHPLFKHKIVPEDPSGTEKQKALKQIHEQIDKFQSVLKKEGTGKEWLIFDVPEKDVVFTKGMKSLVKDRKSDSLVMERDPVKIISKNGEAKLLIDHENALMKHLAGYTNFTPNVYGSENAYQILKLKGLVE